MEDLFADIFRTFIDYWMNQEAVGAFITFVGVLELAIQSAIMLLARDGGVTATVEGADDED